jgi:hypothetical protein
MVVWSYGHPTVLLPFLSVDTTHGSLCGGETTFAVKSEMTCNNYIEIRCNVWKDMLPWCQNSGEGHASAPHCFRGSQYELYPKPTVHAQ